MRTPVVALLSAIFLVSVARGDDASARSITGEHLGKMLRAMGYEPQPLSDELYQVTIEKDYWKVHTLVALSPDRARVWLECKFPPIADTQRVPPATWLKLLEENERIGPAHFVFKKSDQRIHLFQAVDNVELTPARLKQALDAFDGTVRKTQAVWGDELLMATREALTTAPREIAELDAATELQKLQGGWRIVALELRGIKASARELEDVKPTLSFEGDVAVLQSGPDVQKVTRVRISGLATAPQIDFVDSKKRIEKGIYRLEGDSLTICFAAPEDERPAVFATDVNHSLWLLTLKREKR